MASLSGLERPEPSDEWGARPDDGECLALTVERYEPRKIRRSGESALEGIHEPGILSIARLGSGRRGEDGVSKPRFASD